MQHLITRRRALAASVAAAGATLMPQFGRAQNLPTLRIAYQPYQYSAQALYAQGQGFFIKAGLNVELQQISLGAALASGVASGAADIGIATISTLAVAHARGIPFVCVAPAAEFEVRAKPVALLLVGNQTTIHSAKDMNGKTVGTPGLSTMGEYGIRAWVDANGGDASTLKFQELPFSQMPSAFQTGRIDAASIGEPFLTDALKYARVLASNTQAALGPHYLVTAWFATQPWAQAHPDLVARFVAAIREATVWGTKNPQKCIDIIARTFKQDPGTMSPDTLATFGERITPADVQPQITVTARYAKFAPFPATDLIYVPKV